MALGAKSKDVLALVAGPGAAPPVLLGVGVGVVAAVSLMHSCWLVFCMACARLIPLCLLWPVWSSADPPHRSRAICLHGAQRAPIR